MSINHTNFAVTNSAGPQGGLFNIHNDIDLTCLTMGAFPLFSRLFCWSPLYIDADVIGIHKESIDSGI